MGRHQRSGGDRLPSVIGQVKGEPRIREPARIDRSGLHPVCPRRRPLEHLELLHGVDEANLDAIGQRWRFGGDRVEQETGKPAFVPHSSLASGPLQAGSGVRNGEEDPGTPVGGKERGDLGDRRTGVPRRSRNDRHVPHAVRRQTVGENQPIPFFNLAAGGRPREDSIRLRGIFVVTTEYFRRGHRLLSVVR